MNLPSDEVTWEQGIYQCIDFIVLYELIHLIFHI